MSLTKDGLWKAGLWATTLWADGLWREGSGPTPPPPAPPSTEQFSGGFTYPADRRRRHKDEEGIPDAALAVIDAVAERQVAQPAADAQQRFEELERELTLRGLEWEARYLEALAQVRERLLRQRQATHILLLLAASV